MKCRLTYCNVTRFGGFFRVFNVDYSSVPQHMSYCVFFTSGSFLFSQVINTLIHFQSSS